MKVLWALVVTWFILGGYQSSQTAQDDRGLMKDKEELDLVTATFAGGCFWCTEALFLSYQRKVLLEENRGGKEVTQEEQL